MRQALFTAFLLWTISAAAQNSEFIVVPEGNVSALIEALQDIYDRGPGGNYTVQIGGSYKLGEDDVLPAINSHLKFQTPQAIFSSRRNSSPSRLFLVEQGASLSLSNTEIIDLGGNGEAGLGLIENYGALILSRIQFKNARDGIICFNFGICTTARPILYNAPSGSLLMEQSSIVDSGVTSVIGDDSRRLGFLVNDGEATVETTQINYSSSGAFNNFLPPIINAGTLQLTSISAHTGAHIPFLVFSHVGGSRGPVIENSVVAGFGSAWCRRVNSNGYNFIENADCEFDSEGDQVGVSTGMIWRPVSARLITERLLLIPASPAIDALPRARCRNFPIQDGDGDGVEACDAGAWETPAASLADGGVNGLYYNPDADGHYLYILDNDFNTMVLWNTFDQDGNQAWVYGTGELVQGRSVVVDAYLNLDGSVSLEGDIQPSESVERWGTLEVEILNCNEGVVAFNSERPEFGTGQFNIRRLAFVRQLGCVD